MSNKIRLRIVTPRKIMFDKPVDMVILRGQEGDLGILAGHAPLTTGLSIGILRITDDSSELALAVHGGFVEINSEMVTVLTDIAEWPKEIDEKRALNSKERAEGYIDKQNPNIDIDRASIALRKALNRIEVSKLTGL
jgi:F-type H+-transporting ATPase subunit epsilon